MLFEEVYKENYKIIYGYLFCLCKNDSIAEELTSETFLKAFSKFSTFKGNSKLSTWLCQIAKNEYLHHLKKQKHTEHIEDFSDMPDSVLMEDVIQDKSMTLTIHKVLHELEEPYKEVFILRIFAELSFKEIAVIMGKTETWSRVTYYRAKMKIIESLGDTDDK